MLRFSTKDLLLSTGLFALGMSGVWVGTHIPSPYKDSPVVGLFAIVLWFSMGTCFGAAIGVLFKAPYKGAILGFVVQFVFTILMLPAVYS